MLQSLAGLPHQLDRFWGANIGIKIQIIILLAILYFLGYYSAKFLRSGVWWKWLIVLIFFAQALIQIYNSNNIVFIGPVAIGFIRGFFVDRFTINPFYRLQGLFKWVLSLFARRGSSKAEKLNQEAEEALRRSQEYERQTKQAYDRQQAEARAEREQFEEEKRRQRQEQVRNNKRPSRSWESKSHNSSSAKSQAPKELNPEVLADAYEILGVRQEANLDECKKAYRLLMSLYHPDKVAQLNENRRKQAEEETKQINSSWETIKKS